MTERADNFYIVKTISSLIFVFVLVVVAFIVKVNIVHAADCGNMGYTNMKQCDFVTKVASPETDQAFIGHIQAMSASDGDTVSAFGCLNSSGEPNTGSCWTFVAPRDANQGFPINNSYTIDDNGFAAFPPYKYWWAHFYAYDAQWYNIFMQVDGRHVSVSSFDVPASVNMGETFNVCWGTDWASEAILSWSGAINSGSDSVNPGGCYSLTAGSTAGTIQVELNPRGPICAEGASDCNNWLSDFSGPEIRYITVNQNNPGPFQLSSSACYDTGKFDLNWTPSQGADYYEVWNHAWSFGGWNFVGTTTNTYFTEQEGLGTDWYFKVVARNNSGGSTDSSPNANNQGLLGGNCPVPVPGCTNPAASNYNPGATVDNGTCTFNCSGSDTQSCISGANACGQTSSGTETRSCNTSNGTWGGWSACSASIPANPAGYGNVCSPANSCGDTNSGTIQCNGSCSVSAPAERAGYGNTCTSSANACGQTNSGTIQCNGSCSATTPPNTCVPTPTISCTPGTVGYGGASTISWSCTNSSSGNVPGIGSGTSGSGSTGALTSNQTYTVTCVGFNGSNPTASCPVTVTAPTVTISNNQTLPWNSAPTLSWTPANSATCTATNGTINTNPATGWPGNKEASTGTNSWTSDRGITVPGTYAYSIRCSGNGDSEIATSYVTISNPIPTSYSVTYSPPDYCVSPGGYVAWSYSDPSGSPQTAYEVQVTDIGNFNNPMYDSGKLNSSSHVFSIPSDILAWDTTFKARVRVWNSYDSVSAWSDPSNSWKTPPYPYPGVRPPNQFTWTPSHPQQYSSTQFTDHTLFGGGNTNSREWSWTFGDGGTSSAQSPAHTYSAVGNYTVSVTVTDAANQTCNYTQSVNVQKPVPVIKEVAPK